MIKIDHFQQTGGYCNPAVLKMVLGSYGFVRSEKWYAENLNVTRNGCDLMAKARKRKINSWGFEVDYEKDSNLERVSQLNSEGVPVVAYVSEDEIKTGKKVGHYIVIYGVDNKVHIADPILKRNSCKTKRALENMWYDPHPGSAPKEKEIYIIRPKNMQLAN